MAMSYREKRDLLKAWLALSLAFTILYQGTNLDFAWTVMFGISALTVGVGFLLHELAHRYFAKKYGLHAEFVSFDSMLLLAIFVSFFGFIIAAPGAVFMKGHATMKQRGMISASGPATNMVLAALFLALAISTEHPLINTISSFGYYINTLLGLFNMLPFGNFDGIKVLHWSKPAYGIILGAGIILLMAGGLV